MRNLRVTVNNAADQTEARNIMISLGYLPKEITCISGGDLGFVVNAHNENGATYKEITLPELRDLVVLKRNSIDDATHEDKNDPEFKYRLIDNHWHVITEGNPVWRKDSIDLNEAPLFIKPIEKTEMKAKEYLNKETYAYVKTHDLVSKDSNWIEIPEWAVAYAYHKNGHGFFYDSFCKIASFYNIVWSRHTPPEELPFIDDEPLQSLNDQYAEIEKVRQSHRTASETADPTIKETLSQRQEQYGSFEDVATATQDLLKILEKTGLKSLPSMHKEALHMICSKMVRIVNGDHNFIESWHDIAGYATLMENELRVTDGATNSRLTYQKVINGKLQDI